MTEVRWKPNTTVAAVIEHEGRFLLVEEETDDGVRINQPAGHLDWGESLITAAAREAREETGYQFVPSSLVGIYQWGPPAKGDLCYLRFAFAGSVIPDGLILGVDVLNAKLGGHDLGGQHANLDDGILRAVWLNHEEVLACRDRHRSPLVLQCIDDWLAGRCFPLDLIRHYD